tara:strand:- start:4122 stop:4466 length:345 start_codon:yes stop_codon:yes gene_type:complete
MGYLRDNAIIVSGYECDEFKACHKRAQEIFGEEQVSPIMGPYVNLHCSFFVPPNGSKLGWQAATQGELDREEYRTYLSFGYRHSWVEVQFNDDDMITKIIADSDNTEERKNDRL